MKSRDNQLLEEAYDQIREGMFDKAKEFVNKNIVQYDTNAPGGQAHSLEPYKKFLAAIPGVIAASKDKPQNPHRKVQSGNAVTEYILDVLNIMGRNSAANLVPKNSAEILYKNPSDGREGPSKHPLVKAMVELYDPATMKQPSVYDRSSGDTDQFETDAKHSSLAAQQKFAMGRKADTGMN